MNSKSLDCHVVLLGNAGVGKTTFFNQLKGSSDTPSGSETDVCTREYEFGGEIVKFTIWDTGGHESYRSLTPSYYRRAQLVICMYSVEKVPHSKYDLKRWIVEAQTHAMNPTIVLVANDPDDIGVSSTDGRELKRADSEDLQKQYDISSHFRISAKSKQQVEDTFREIAKTFYDEWQKSSLDRKKQDGIKMGADSELDKQGCNACFRRS